VPAKDLRRLSGRDRLPIGACDKTVAAVGVLQQLRLQADKLASLVQKHSCDARSSQNNAWLAGANRHPVESRAALAVLAPAASSVMHCSVDYMFSLVWRT
jgi:hypothetical protein